MRIPWHFRVWAAIRDAILKPSSEAENSFLVKSRTGDIIWDNFFFRGISLNEVVPE